MHTVYILLGGNQGDTLMNFANAKRELLLSAGNILAESSLYQTEAWGYADQPAFLNQVIIINTKLKATEVLNLCLHAEKLAGRVRTTKNAPRLIDLDLLFYDADIINEASLQVPHPRIPERKFVLVPLCELTPQFIHPVLGKPLSQLLAETTDQLAVEKI